MSVRIAIPLLLSCLVGCHPPVITTGSTNDMLTNMGTAPDQFTAVDMMMCPPVVGGHFQIEEPIEFWKCGQPSPPIPNMNAHYPMTSWQGLQTTFQKCGKQRQGNGFDTMFSFSPPGGLDIVIQRIVIRESFNDGFLGLCPPQGSKPMMTTTVYTEYFLAPAYDLQAAAFCCDADLDTTKEGFVKFANLTDLINNRNLGPLPPIPQGENAVNLTIDDQNMADVQLLTDLASCPDITWSLTVNLHNCIGPTMHAMGNATDFYSTKSW